MLVRSITPLLRVSEADEVTNAMKSDVVAVYSAVVSRQVVKQNIAQIPHSFGDRNRNKSPWKAELGVKRHTTTYRKNITRAPDNVSLTTVNTRWFKVY